MSKLRFSVAVVAGLALPAAAAPFAYVGNASNSVSVVDLATSTVTATIAVPCTPLDLAVVPSGARAYATCSNNVTMSVIETSTNTVAGTVATNTGTLFIAINASGTTAYVSRSVTNDVFVLDLATDTITGSIAGFTSPSGIAFHPDGASAYVADAAGFVRVVDTTALAVVASVPVGASPAEVAFNPAGTRAYVTNGNSNSVSVIDTVSRTVIATVPVGAGPRGVAVNAAGTRLFVANNAMGANTLSIIDTATNTVVSTLPTGAGTRPRHVEFAPDGRYLVVNQGANTTSIYDAATDTVQATVPVGTQPVSLAIVPASPPSVTIDQAAAQADPTNAATVNFTAVFSEAVTGLTGADISFAGSTVAGTLVANVTGGPTTYNVAVSGMTSGGTLVVGIPAGAAADSIGSPSLASTSADNAVTIDLIAPTVTIDQAGAQVDPTLAAPVLFTVAFSEPVTGFTGADVSLAGSTVGGVLVANVTGAGASYTVSVTGMSGAGTVVASIPAAGASDLAGNANLVSTSADNTVTFDDARPTAIVQPLPLQPNPATTSPILFAVNFNEPVIGFTGSDVGFAGSTAAGPLVASVSGSGATYTVSVSGMTSNGFVILDFPAGAVTDLAGNTNLAVAAISGVTYIGAGAVLTTYTGPSGTGSGNITASFTGGGPACSFSGPQFIGSPPGAAPIPPSVPPGSIGFPHGLFAFTTVNCTPGSTLAFTITYPSALPSGAQYWKYGPEPGNATPHWYVLPATIAGNVATFTITDGAQGDDDLAANGTIVDQGGPGVPVTPGAQQTPTLSEWAMALMALLMLVGAARNLRRPAQSRGLRGRGK
jgi:YVTN family beta-propeller protein